MSLHLNAKQVNAVQTKEKLNKKDMFNNYETVVLKQFYQRLAKRHNKIIKALLFDNEPQPQSPEKSQENISFVNENQFADDRIQQKTVLLPNLQTRANFSFREKVTVNESVYIHEIIPIKKSQVTFKKKLSIQQGEKKTQSYFHSFGSISSKKIADMEAVQANSLKEKHNYDIFIPKNQFVRHKSNTKINAKSNSQIIVYPIDDKKSPLKLETTKNTLDKNSLRQIFHRKTRIQKIIDHYKAIKQKRQKNESIIDNHIVNAIQNRQRIKVEGEQTIYCEKKSPKKMKKQSSITSIPKVKYINWKIKELPFTDITKHEVTRLLSMYLFNREAVPAPSGHYKVYVGDGNNGQLITRLLKNRGWWLPTDDMAEANLIWTQLPHEQQMKRVPSHEQIVLSSNNKDYLLLSDNSSMDKAKIARFLKYKHNPFFNACEKLMYGPIYNKFMSEFISKFMDNQYLRSYFPIRDQVAKFYPSRQLQKVESKSLTLINHCENSNQIGDKKQLFFHIQKYCEVNAIDKSTMIPKTTHINQTHIERLKANNTETEILQHLKMFQLQEALYILKPGEQSNRGNGITVHQSKQSLIQHISQSLITFPQNKTYIVQEYIDPLLYEGRKFDIRVWALYSNNRLWFYREGYVRTSCKEYSTKNMNKFIHLTNDAVQKHSDQYGKHEPANKVSFHELDKYLRKNCSYDLFYSEIYASIKKLTTRLFQVGNLMMGRSCHQFQLFGLDFLIDKDFKVWLIECNTNPSIEICCSLLNRLVPNMLENLLTIVVDPLFPAVERKAFKEDFQWNSERFNFQLLLDGVLDTKYLETLENHDRQYLAKLATINQHKLKPYLPSPTPPPPPPSLEMQA